MRDEGIDITLRGNPGHVLVPDDMDMFRKAKLRQIKSHEFEKWYRDLFVSRWNSGRKEEILQLMKQGKDKDIKLCCFCTHKDGYCHATLAAKYLNQLISKMLSNDAE